MTTYGIVLMIIMWCLQLALNVFWFIKIVEGKWLYLWYSTVIMVIWTLFVLSTIS